MRVLVACERSGAVRRAFRTLGHDAWSCDLEPADDGDLCHFLADALYVLKHERFDLMIAHPPCTFLSVSGMHWTARGLRDHQLTEDALNFVRKLMSAHVARIAIENPVSIISSRIRKPDQIIQPYQFGHDASKRTCLWLKGLQHLRPTKYVPPRTVDGKPRWSNQTDSGQNRLPPSRHRATQRSETYAGIAQAMAEQWGGEV